MQIHFTSLIFKSNFELPPLQAAAVHSGASVEEWVQHHPPQMEEAMLQPSHLVSATYQVGKRKAAVNSFDRPLSRLPCFLDCPAAWVVGFMGGSGRHTEAAQVALLFPTRIDRGSGEGVCVERFNQADGVVSIGCDAGC